MPIITPEKRREQIESKANESDDDILIVTEKVDIGEGSNERGRLLQQSTLKPPPAERQPAAVSDEIPPNHIDTTKRIVRIVNKERMPTIDVTVVPTTKSIGVQVGTPSPELNKRRMIPPVVAPSPEPPLNGFWTHRVNLPYPPAVPANANQPIFQQPQPYQPLVPTHTQQPIFQQPQLQYFQSAFMPMPPAMPMMQQQPLMQATPLMYQPPPTRRQKRNFNKSQKYLQRKSAL